MDQLISSLSYPPPLSNIILTGEKSMFEIPHQSLQINKSQLLYPNVLLRVAQVLPKKKEICDEIDMNRVSDEPKKTGNNYTVKELKSFCLRLNQDDPKGKGQCKDKAQMVESIRRHCS